MRTLCEAGETRALVLGAAGMTLGKGAPCALDVTFVDIDPAQERIAALFLDAPLETAGIIVDTYSNRRSQRRRRPRGPLSEPAPPRWLGEKFPGPGAIDPSPAFTDGETCAVCGGPVTWSPGSPCPDCGDIGLGSSLPTSRHASPPLAR